VCDYLPKNLMDKAKLYLMMYGLCIVCIMLCIIYLTESPLMHLSTVVLGPALILTSHPHHIIQCTKYNTVAGGQDSLKHLSNDLSRIFLI